MFESRISAEELKNIHALKIFVFLRGPKIWRVMSRNVWNDIVSWQTRRLNNSTKYLLHALTTIISRKKNEICWRLVKKYALKLFWNVYTWHELEDLIFCGQWTNLHDRLRNGPKLVTNDHLVWSPTFITQVSTNNIVMWGTLQNSADWDCFKSPILQKILRIRNLLQMEHCVFQNTFVPICWMCKQQTSVSHSSTESKIISLDASLRVDGIFDRYCSWRKYEQSRYRVRSSPHTIHKRKQFQRVINDLESVVSSLKRPIFSQRSYVVHFWR